MKFRSYAQNFEDVMLWRALGHIQHGFYVDLGAWSPDYDSVTRAFYERGWRGVNVEPNPKLWGQLVQRRPLDVNLRVAVAATAGTVLMNFVENSGLSTLDDSIAIAHEAAGWSSQREEVRVVRLEDIFREFVVADQPIHFLKIDVEGLECEIIRDFSWSLYRPWVLVIEATKPMSQEASYEDWEPVLLESAYGFVFSDGLNRFYVAKEHFELAVKFKDPPNYFDQFELAQHAETRESLERLVVLQSQTAQELAEARISVAGLPVGDRDDKRKLFELEAARQGLLARVQALEGSVSWRITAPLRQTLTWMQAPVSRLKGPLKRLVSWGLRRPRLVQAVHMVLRCVPPLHRATMFGIDVLVAGRPRDSYLPRAFSPAKPWLMLERPSASAGSSTFLETFHLDRLLAEAVQVGHSRWDIGFLLAVEGRYQAVGAMSVAPDIDGLHARDSVLLILTEATVRPGQLEQIRELKARGVRVSVLVTLSSLAAVADRDRLIKPWANELLSTANALVCSPAVSQEWATVVLQSSLSIPFPEMHLLEAPQSLKPDATMAYMVGKIIASLRPLLHEHLVGISGSDGDPTTVDDALARIRQELRVFHHA